MRFEYSEIRSAMNLYNLEYEEKLFNDSIYEMIIRINIAIFQRIRITHVKEYDG